MKNHLVATLILFGMAFAIACGVATFVLLRQESLVRIPRVKLSCMDRLDISSRREPDGREYHAGSDYASCSKKSDKLKVKSS